jgi:phosphotransferase system enzyme I (PtsI)
MLTGIPVFPGISIGEALVIEPEAWDTFVDHEKLANEENEVKRLQDAINQTKQSIKLLKQQAIHSLGKTKAAIFDAHLAFLSDPMFVGEMIKSIRNEHRSAESIVHQTVESFISVFQELDDEYMRHRASDIRDVGKQLLGYLTGSSAVPIPEMNRPVIIIAHDLTPSHTVQLTKPYVLGFATEIGGSTSHTAIMARAMGLPSVVGVTGGLMGRVKTGDLLILDGKNGEIIVNPDPEQLEIYQSKMAQEKAEQDHLMGLIEVPAECQDGHRLKLGVNIGRPEDLPLGLEKGAEEVGLFRTEFLFMDRSSFPSEEDQYSAYRQVVELANGRAVIIRTLDIGGDKPLPYFHIPKEANPFLGWRALRISLDRIDLFKTQLRAILRASALGKVRIMFPMVSSVEQVRQTKSILEQVKKELTQEKLAYDTSLELGVMIEVPSAAIIADQLAKEVDFFSIGTNDLVQYTLAVDRMNENVNVLYDHYHPAVLRLIHQVAQASQKRGIWAGMCGEMAGDPLVTPLLVGLGLDELSMGAASILPIKEQIRKLNYRKALELAKRVLELSTAAEVKEELQRFNPLNA